MIISPNHPSTYGNSLDCNLIIRFASGSKVELEFLEFDIEAHSSCRYDYLEVLEGDTSSANRIGSKLCGRQKPSPIISSGNRVYLKFHTDGTTARSGFKIQAVEVAGKSYSI